MGQIAGGAPAPGAPPKPPPPRPRLGPTQPRKWSEQPYLGFCICRHLCGRTKARAAGPAPAAVGEHPPARWSHGPGGVRPLSHAPVAGGEGRLRGNSWLPLPRRHELLLNPPSRGFIRAVWDAAGVQTGQPRGCLWSPASPLPPTLLPAWAGSCRGYGKKARHIKKGLKLLSLSHLELILLHHELQSRRSITAHLHIFH